jgi:hypothetical protein
MTDMGWLIAGGAALSGTIGMFWGYVKTLWAQLASYIIVTTAIEGRLTAAINMYAWKNFKPTRFGPRSYTGWSMFVRPVKRVQLIAMELLGAEGKLFWKGWRPIWISKQTKAKGENNNGGPQPGTRITFLRGMFDLEAIIIGAVAEYNRVRASTDTDSQQSRYRVVHVFGTANKIKQDGGAREIATSSPHGDCNWDAMEMLENRILQWKGSDLGNAKMNHGNALGQQALSPEAVEVVNEVKRWKNSEDWYKGRGIPWRRGYRLEGPPGTGKTSLVRALAEDLDLPVFVFDLATLYNDELQEAWQKMLGNVPCVALIEDIDSVFVGRENKVGGHLTFDSLLNCLDGIERADGILLFVTTNNPEKLDTALSENRPGRIDRCLTLATLDMAGRMLLCKRILKEWPELWDKAASDGEGDTGAKFQERLTQIALHQYWTEKIPFDLRFN